MAAIALRALTRPSRIRPTGNGAAVEVRGVRGGR